MQIFVLYISTVSRIFGFLATWHTYFCQDSKCFFGVFSACSKKHRKEVSGDLHINLVVHSPGKERLFVTSSCWCVFFWTYFHFLLCGYINNWKTFISQWIMFAFQLQQDWSSIWIMLSSPLVIFKALGKVNFSIKAIGN